MLEEYDHQMEVLRKQIEPYLVNLQPAVSGDWQITSFEVKKDIEALRCWRDGRPVPPGRYTKLSGPKGLFMTDTPAEMNDARELFWSAAGHVLITGLGLGMIPRMLLNPAAVGNMTTGEVKRITIVEIEQDVINLVAPSLKDLPVEIVHADAFEWTPPNLKMFDWAWHDIWPDMSTDNIPEISQLRKRYGKYMKRGGRQMVWAEDFIKAQQRRYG